MIENSYIVEDMLSTIMKEKEETDITCSDIKNIIKRFNN